MFAPDSVGVLDSTHELIFGLQSKYNKEVIIAPEVNSSMVGQLSSDVFKKMISGELINVAETTCILKQSIVLAKTKEQTERCNSLYYK